MKREYEKLDGKRTKLCMLAIQYIYNWFRFRLVVTLDQKEMILTEPLGRTV